MSLHLIRYDCESLFLQDHLANWWRPCMQLSIGDSCSSPGPSRGAAATPARPQSNCGMKALTTVYHGTVRSRTHAHTHAALTSSWPARPRRTCRHPGPESAGSRRLCDRPLTLSRSTARWREEKHLQEGEKRERGRGLVKEGGFMAILDFTPATPQT